MGREGRQRQRQRNADKPQRTETHTAIITAAQRERAQQGEFQAHHGAADAWSFLLLSPWVSRQFFCPLAMSGNRSVCLCMHFTKCGTYLTFAKPVDPAACRKKAPTRSISPVFRVHAIRGTDTAPDISAVARSRGGVRYGNLGVRRRYCAPLPCSVRGLHVVPRLRLTKPGAAAPRGERGAGGRL